MPDFAFCSATLDYVVGDLGASIVSGGVPGQEAGLVGDFRDVEGSRRTRLIWGKMNTDNLEATTFQKDWSLLTTVIVILELPVVIADLEC